MPTRRGPRPALRLISLLASFTLLFVAVVGKLIVLQVVKAEPLEKLGSQQRIRIIQLPAERGSILDRNGSPLALSAEARAIYANPKMIPQPALVSAQIAPLLGLDEDALTIKLSNRATGFVYLARRVAPNLAARVMALQIPTVGTLRETRRIYPAGSTAGQILGFVDIDGLGLAGLEQRYDKVLRGTPGKQVIEQDPGGRAIPQGRNSIVEAREGEDLSLTIDRDLQFFVEAALERGAIAHGAEDATAIVLDVRNGDVMAMANWPPVAPARFGAVSPFVRRNRAVTDSYEPGSVNKVITAAAAIEDGIARPGTKIRVPYAYRVGDRMFKDYHYHPTQTMTYAQAMSESSNVATIKIAEKLGKRRLDEALRAFGLGRQTGVGFPGEASGILMAPDDWYATSMGTIPIGQGIAVTPLQVAAAYATIANDGIALQPRLVRGTIDAAGTLHEAKRAKSRRVVSAYTAAQVRGMLIGVVERGTGARAKIPGYLVGGKTGTARVPLVGRRGYSNKIVTTFVGMAPADDPRYVVLVSMNNPTPRIAAATAAPVVREILQYSLAHARIAPTVSLPDTRRLDLLRARPLSRALMGGQPALESSEPKKRVQRP